MTNAPLNDRRFVHNLNLKNAIEEYCLQQETCHASNRFLTFTICYGRPPSAWRDKPRLKICLSLLGGSNVGKTTLTRFLQHGAQASFVHCQSAATIGPDLIFFYLNQLYDDTHVVIIQLSDIPGMERFESCCDSHFRNCHGALFVADSTLVDSLERIEHYWHPQLHLKGRDHVETLLVCNKIDLWETNADDTSRRVFLKRAAQFASSYNISVHHISALRGDNIQTTFKELIIRILNNASLMQSIKDNEFMNEPSPPVKESSIYVSMQQPASRQRHRSKHCCKSA